MKIEVVKLTGIIIPIEELNRFTGRVKEVGGIIMAGQTKEETLINLQEAAEVMMKYKEDEYRQVYSTQSGIPIEELKEVRIFPEVVLPTKPD